MKSPVFYPKLSTQGRLLVGIPLLCEFIFVSVLMAGQAQLELENNREGKTRELLLCVNNELKHMVQLGTAIGLAHLARSKQASDDLERLEHLLQADRKLLLTITESLNDSSITDFDRAVGSLIDKMKQIELMSFNGDRLDAARGLISIESLVKRVTAGGESIADEQNERVAKFKRSQDRLRKGLNILVLFGVILNTLIAVVLAELFRRQTADRLSVLHRNSLSIAASRPLEAPLQGVDELKEIDASFHSMFEALKLARIRERSILDNAGELICELSTSGELLRINAHGETILKSNGTAGKQLASFLNPASVNLLSESLSSLATGKATEFHIDLEIGNNGEPATKTEWSLQKLKSENVIVCVARDVTEKKKIELLRQDLVQMVSHDLRSPLNGLQHVFSMLDGGTFGPLSEKGLLRVAQANEATKFMVQLIDQLLMAEKLRSNVSSMMFSNCDLREIVELAINDVVATAEKKEVRIRQELKSVVVECDELIIRRVLQNLLYNAIKFSPANSEIELIVDGGTADVMITISDKGKGIVPGTENQLFEKFSQGDARVDRSQGFGVGLAFCKVAVEAHGGRIGIKGLNPGSMVWLSLPRQRIQLK